MKQNNDLLNMYLEQCHRILDDEIYVLRNSTSNNNNVLAKKILSFAQEKRSFQSWTNYFYNELTFDRYKLSVEIDKMNPDDDALIEEFEQADSVFLRFFTLISTADNFLSELGRNSFVLSELNEHNYENENSQKSIRLARVLQKLIVESSLVLLEDLENTNIPDSAVSSIIRIKNIFYNSADIKLSPRNFSKRVSEIFNEIQEVMNDVFDENKLSKYGDDIFDQNAEFYTFIITLDTANYYCSLFYDLFLATYLETENGIYDLDVLNFHEEMVEQVHYLALDNEDSDYSHLKN